MTSAVMRDPRVSANRLIDDFGRDAAGEALLLAIACRAACDAASQSYWVDVTAIIMETQGHARPLPRQLDLQGVVQPLSRRA
jgi:hypothetical protein